MQQPNLPLIAVFCSSREAIVWINPAHIVSVTVQPHQYDGKEVYHAIIRTVDQHAFYITEAAYGSLLSGANQ